MGDDYLPREEDIRPSGGVLVYEPPDTTEPPDDLGLDGLDDRLRGVEKRLGQMTTWIIILVVVIFTLGVAAVVDLASYAPVVHVASPQGAKGTRAPTGPIPTSPSPPVAASSGVASAPPVILAVHPASGPGAGGKRITVVGTNLQGARSVLFGNLPATGFMVNATGTTIVAFTPTDVAGIVNVTVTTPKGTTPTRTADQYTYLAPTITRVVQKGGVAGTSVTIIGVALDGSKAVTFGGTPATNFTVSTNGTRITAIAPAHGAGPATITVTTPGGSTSAAAPFAYP